jgi:sodium-coupled neutral amino acid transporter 2
VHPIANELELSTEPSDMKMRKVVRECLMLCTSIYFCTGLFAYLLFGEATSDDVLANFDANLGIPFSHTLTLLVRASYAVHIMLVFPLLHFSLRLNVDGLLFPKAAALVHDNLRFALITGFLVFLIFFGSTLVPNIWVAFEYTGATVGVCLAFIFPGLIMLK